MKRQLFIWQRLCSAAVCCIAVVASGQIGPTPSLPKAVTPNAVPPQTVGVEVVERLAHQIPLDLQFIDSQGKPVELGHYFSNNKPVILALVYFDCPVVCPIVLGKLTDAFREIDFSIGKDYNVIVASIDPKEPYGLAAEKKTQYLQMYDRDPEVTSAGWAFLTAPGDETRMLANEVGWNYRPLSNDEYSHPVCIFFLSPEGKVARYVYGLGYDPQTMRMALLEASQGKISPSIGDKIRMFCFRFDPNTGKYSMVAMRVAQLTGVLMILGVGTLIGGLLVKERIRKRHAHAAVPSENTLSQAGSQSVETQDSGPTP